MKTDTDKAADQQGENYGTDNISEMNSDQVDAFLAEYKKAGVEPIALKAVITGNNIFWTAERTQKELLREHLFMSNIYKSNM